MAATTTAPKQLRKGEKVLARTTLRDVPEGTAGKVIVVDGFTWIRYWVRFDNGVSLGSISRQKLATPAQWKRQLDGDEDVDVASNSAAADGAAESADGDAGAGDKATPSGTLVPQKLLDRSAAARARLGG
ncbi:MAG: hypothetical protein ACR2MB_12885 [Acidimicrobiales bacterium]